MTVNDAHIRLALKTDALVSGATGVLLLTAAGLLASPLGAPVALLIGTGAVLIPFAAFVFWVSARQAGNRALARAVIAANAVWVAASVAIVLTGWLELTVLGTVFVLAQAAAVAFLAEWQIIALRKL